jgi:hypothetical protein
LTGGTNAIITTIDTALASVGTVRAQLGASSNRLEHVYNNLGNMITNTTASRGRMLDADYAAETSNSTSQQRYFGAEAEQQLVAAGDLGDAVMPAEKPPATAVSSSQREPIVAAVGSFYPASRVSPARQKARPT